MKKTTNFIITQESIDEQVKAHRFNPGLEITFVDADGLHRHKIGAGSSDDVSVFQDNGTTIVLTCNTRLEYAGLESFRGDQKTGEVFLIGNEMYAAFGSDDLEPARMVEILQQWL